MKVQTPKYLNLWSQKFYLIWGRLFMCFLGMFSSVLFAQITIVENTKISIAENAYIYTEKEVVGCNHITAVKKEKGFLLVSNSKLPSEKRPKKTEHNPIDQSQKKVAKTNTVEPKKQFTKLQSQPLPKNFLTIGIEKSIAVVTTYYRAIVIVPQTFAVKHQKIQNIIPVFGSVVNTKSNNYHITQKTRPPPLFC